MMIGGLFAMLYGMALAFAGLSFGNWQFWVLFILYFCGRYLGYCEGRKE